LRSLQHCPDTIRGCEAEDEAAEGSAVGVAVGTSLTQIGINFFYDFVLLNCGHFTTISLAQEINTYSGMEDKKWRI
jgi:hypothetical protein